MKRLSPARHQAIMLMHGLQPITYRYVPSSIATITLKWLITNGYVEVIETRRKDWLVLDYKLTKKGEDYAGQ